MQNFLMLLLTLPIPSFGQKKFLQGELVQKNFCETVHFEYVRNKILIPVQINGKTRKFIFDTGATLLISDEIQAEMQNTILPSGRVSDISGIKSEKSVVLVSEMQIGNLTFQNIPSFVYDVKNTGLVACLEYDGLIGSNVFRNCIVHIDIDKKIIIITDDLEQLELKNPFQTAITFDKQGGPFIKLNLDNNIEFEGLFDSGTDKFMSISQKISDQAIKNKISKVLNQGFGIGSIGMNGIGAAIEKDRTTIKNVKFGAATISNFITIVTEKSKNSIGMGLADYGTITIDYINKNFYFVAKTPIQEFKNKKTLGFSLEPEKDYYAIGIVWTGTEAEKIGLKTGYQIMELNDIDFSKRTYQLDCIWLFSNYFTNSKIKLSYKNNEGEVLTVELLEE